MEGTEPGSDYIGANLQLANLGQNSSWMEGTGSGRLVLTLCKSDARGSYHHATIPLSKSYEGAVNEACQVFEPYIDYDFEDRDIVLKRAIKRANGTGAWGILRPADWRSVIRPDGDEVGVFLLQDSLDLPYEPRQSLETRSKIMYLTLKTGYGNEANTMIKGPETYQACQEAAYNAFLYSNAFDCDNPDDIILQIKREKHWQELPSWSVVTPETYSVLLSTYHGDPIVLWVVADRYRGQ